MDYPEVKFRNPNLGDLTLSVGKYTSYEGEDKLYYLAVEGEDDFLIQYDSLSYEHVLGVYEHVLSEYVGRTNFIEYFCNYSKYSYLVNRLDS